MKMYFLKVSILFLICLSFFAEKIVFASLPLSGKTIVVDSGHGGLDPGTMYKDVYEKDINLAISLALETELKDLGAEVILIRYGDYDLSKPKSSWRKKSDFDNRIQIINNSNADYYLSIHLNYLEDFSYYGPQVFYNMKSDKNKVMAEQIQSALNQELKTDREVKTIPTSTYMYGRLKTTGVLIECGFLSNPRERGLLLQEEYQKKLAKIIASSVANLKF